ncbi:Interferon-related developmental regulator family protein [Rhynchospora pubera]|uniref:Interferon-related developmental regulator family protein n=1 Tax=Rhynchospora pubera TaxID=906938 RepID=A0AAV8CUK3_9POAL|nr:Interferon-related developmental regulator family protein [Rhynchospora pubera]
MAKGYKKNKGHRCDHFDMDDTESIISSRTAMSDVMSDSITEDFTFDNSLDKLVDDLYAKRSLTREGALVKLVDAFESSNLLPFVEDRCSTISHLFINSIKKGMTNESNLACRAIGLLSFTMGGGSSSHEIMEEALPQLCKILSDESDQSKIPEVVKCIALVAFLGADDLDKTEMALEAIWKVIQPKSGYNVTTVNYKPPVVVAAINAWSFLLTTISTWRLNPENWIMHISHLSTLLESDDRSMRMAVGEAIALCFELKLFVNMKAKVIAQIDTLSCEASRKGANKKNLNEQRELFRKIWDYVMNGGNVEETVKISSKKGTILCISSWTKLIQLNFIRHFLRKGFLHHAQDNPLMREIFTFGVDKKENLPKRVKKINRSESEKKLYMMMKKERKVAEARKQSFFNDLMY